MTDLREQLADVIEVAIDNAHDMDVTHRDYANASAEAIIAALPGMVHPLVWETTSLNGYKIGRYAARGETGNWSHYIKRVENGWEYNGNVYLSRLDGLDVALDCAKAEAQAHHVATIMQAFGVQGGEA